MSATRGRCAPLAALLLASCAIIPEGAEPGGYEPPPPVPAPSAPAPPTRPPPPSPTPPPRAPILTVDLPPPDAPTPAPATPAPPPSMPVAEALAQVDAQPLPPLPSRDYDYQPTPMLHLTVPAAPGDNALGLGVRYGPPVAGLIGGGNNARRALHAFRITCPAVINREDRSGLTGAHDWVEPCRAAQRWADSEAAGFFARHFVAVEVGDGRAFATGYYEPEIAASRTRRPGYEAPIYARPADLVQWPQGRAPDPRAGSIGRIVDGDLIPYYDRAAIEAGALSGRGLEIAWARDPVDLFFMQVQGSGLLRLPDGSAMRVGYAANNGYDYVSIGALMRDRGLIGAGETTAQGIAAWLRAHPAEARAIMNDNPRYIFMAANDAPAPGGALGHYVTPHASVAADPNYVPMGAPVLLDLDQNVADGLWVAQDIGGAIRGANRFDTFWGAGEAALAIAGGMGSRGRALVLIPRESAERLRLD